MFFSRRSSTHLGALGIALVAVGYAATAWGQTATDVICSGCVQGTDIEDGTIGPNKLIPGSVNASTIANQSIGPNKLIPGSINASTIANQSIGPNKLIPGSINTSVIGTSAVTGNKIADGAVGFDKLAPGVAAAIAGGPSGSPVIVNVDCLAGDKVQDAVDAAISGRGTTIMIDGICNENLLILKDRITLQGVNVGAIDQIVGVPEADPFVESPISLIGAQLAVIDNLTVSGGQSSGIAATSSFITVSNSVIENNSNNGIVASAGTTARIDNNLIQGNSQHGISIGAGFVQVTNNTILDNDQNGITVFTGGYALIGEMLDGTSGPNTTSGNNNGIVAANFGTALVRNNTIEDNVFDGVTATRGGSVELSDNLVRRNGQYGLLVVDGSNGQLDGGNTIESDAADYFVGAAVAVYRTSNLRVRGDNVIRNNAPRTITNSSNLAGGFALDVEVVSSFRQDSGHTTFVGNIESFNQTTVDLRDADITGSLYADGLDSNFRIRDQSQPSANITLSGGNLYTFGRPVSIRGPGSADQPIFDGDIDCNGSFNGIRSPNFINGHGFVNCPGIP